jgi:hypothetical protein
LSDAIQLHLPNSLEFFQRRLKQVVILQNYVLPYSDTTSLFARIKVIQGRNFGSQKQSRRCWMAVWINPNRPEPRSTYNDWSGLELAYHVFDVEKAQVSVGGLHIAKKKKEILSSSVLPTPT